MSNNNGKTSATEGKGVASGKKTKDSKVTKKGDSEVS